MKVNVIMGVAGCGKTTIGEKLAEDLAIPFFDADDFHSTENIEKMTSGIPLVDDDRWPWLSTLSNKIEEWSAENGAVLACSALKEKYRLKLMGDSPENINWIYLKVDKKRIQQRLEQRQDHFFNPEILHSQFQDLEIPDYGLSVNADQSPDLIVGEILSYLKQKKE